MSEAYVTTRRSLHGLAELVLAGPRYATGGSIQLRVGRQGISTWDVPEVTLSAGELVSGDVRVPLDGSTYAEAAARVGLVARPLDDVYRDGPGISPEEVISLDPDQVRVVERALRLGHEALRAFAPSAQPILWPEHFDVGITVGEVNYGVSPGDGYLARPYAYVGPHRRLSGEFWNAPFGAVRPLDEVGDVAAMAGFFALGAERAEDGAP